MAEVAVSSASGCRPFLKIAILFGVVAILWTEEMLEGMRWVLHMLVWNFCAEMLTLDFIRIIGPHPLWNPRHCQLHGAHSWQLEWSKGQYCCRQ